MTGQSLLSIRMLYSTMDSVKGSPYTLSSDGRTVEDHASIELLQRDRESLEESFDSNMAGQSNNSGL
jgi:hypothetical protein